MELQSGIVYSGEDDFDTFVIRVDGWLCVWRDTVSVVGERFIINAATATNTQAPWSLEVLGAVRYMCVKYGCGELALQNPSDAKKLISNEIIRKLGWWVPGTKGHDKDALRHLATFALKQGWRHTAFIPG
jgi:hypothetical protein